MVFLDFVNRLVDLQRTPLQLSYYLSGRHLIPLIMTFSLISFLIIVSIKKQRKCLIDNSKIKKQYVLCRRSEVQLIFCHCYTGFCIWPFYISDTHQRFSICHVNYMLMTWIFLLKFQILYQFYTKNLLLYRNGFRRKFPIINNSKIKFGYLRFKPQRLKKNIK